MPARTQVAMHKLRCTSTRPLGNDGRAPRTANAVRCPLAGSRDVSAGWLDGGRPRG